MASSDLPVLIVGDVHGDLPRLFGALKPYPPESWRTIFLGDLVNGQPFGVGTLRYARDRPNTTVLLGNHEVITLAGLCDFRERGPRFKSWMQSGGEMHDMEELARDTGLQRWMRQLPAMELLPDGTLCQHSDNDGLGRLVGVATDPAEVVSEVNRAVTATLEAGDFDTLWDLLTPQRVFQRQPMRLASWLQRTGASRVIHGHTPHGKKDPVVYAQGRAINFDGSLGRRTRYRGSSPYRASVAPLPANPFELPPPAMVDGGLGGGEADS